MKRGRARQPSLNENIRRGFRIVVYYMCRDTNCIYSGRVVFRNVLCATAAGGIWPICLSFSDCKSRARSLCYTKRKINAVVRRDLAGEAEDGV